MFAHKACREAVNAIIELAEQAAKDPWEMAAQADLTAAKDKLKKLIGKDIAAAYKVTDKSAALERCSTRPAPRRKAAFADAAPQDQMAAGKLVKKLEAEIVRGAILKDGQRIDGRTTTQIRPIEAMVALPAARARLGAVHARRDAGDLHHHARHQGRRADDRRPDRPVLRELHAAL